MPAAWPVPLSSVSLLLTGRMSAVARDLGSPRVGLWGQLRTPPLLPVRAWACLSLFL